MELEEIESQLCASLSEERFRHSLGVVETAVALADRYGADREKAHLAALLHDCAKNLPDCELKRLCRIYHIRLDHVSKRECRLLHAYVGASLARDKYGVSDQEILDAIYYHTTGKKDMSLLCKIIFLSDMIEPNRKERPFLSAIRQAALIDLDKAILMTLDSTVSYILQKGRLLHLDTLKARNFLLETRKDLTDGNEGKNQLHQNHFRG